MGSCACRLQRVRMLAWMCALGFHCRCQLPEASLQLQALFLVHVERRISVFAPIATRFVYTTKNFFLSLCILLSSRQLTRLICLQLSGKVQSGDELVGEMLTWPCCMARWHSLPLVLTFLS